MKDAFGGAFMIRLFLIFILVYILLTAVALNYAKAFKVKDLVIKYLEDNEIVDFKNMIAEDREKLENYFETVLVGNMGYFHEFDSFECDESNDVYCISGVKIQQMTKPEIANKMGVYYRVTTYFQFDIGFLRVLKAADNSNPDWASDIGRFTVSGETRPIVRK